MVLFASIATANPSSIVAPTMLRDETATGVLFTLTTKSLGEAVVEDNVSSNFKVNFVPVRSNCGSSGEATNKTGAI